MALAFLSQIARLFQALSVAWSNWREQVLFHWWPGRSVCRVVLRIMWWGL